MSYYVILFIAFGLALDAFAAAVAVSVQLKNVSRRQAFRLSWHFGLFQALMPILGWCAGCSVEAYIRHWDHWVAFLLLAGVGGKAIHDGVRSCVRKERSDRTEKNEKARTERNEKDPTRGLVLVVLSVATSIDALAVGLSFAALKVTIFYPALIIGVVAAGMTLLGLFLGARLGRRLAWRAEIVGGVVLVSIGVKILVDHMLAG